MFTDAKMEVSPAKIVGREISRAVEGKAGFGRGGEVGGAANQPGQVSGHEIQYFAGCVSTRDPLRISRKRRQVPVPAIRKLTVLHFIKVVG